MANPWQFNLSKEKKEEAKVETVVEPVVETVDDETPVTPTFRDVAEEEPKQSPASQAEPVVLVSENDAYIHERMKSQPKTLEEIEAKVVQNYDDPTSILEIPKAIKKALEDAHMESCWVSKKKRSLDEYMDVLGMTIVNKALFPKLPKHLFTANGSVERGDSILMCLPAEQAQRLRERPGEISRERIKSTKVQDLSRWQDLGDDRFYKPDGGVSEDDKDEVPRGRYVEPDRVEAQQE